MDNASIITPSIIKIAFDFAGRKCRIMNLSLVIYLHLPNKTTRTPFDVRVVIF
jgi:hypothetical protein